VVDLTCQHKNQTLLVEGPEIKIRPVGARQRSMRERFCADERVIDERPSDVRKLG
jgi:hypothetical protein